MKKYSLNPDNFVVGETRNGNQSTNDDDHNATTAVVYILMEAGRILQFSHSIFSTQHFVGLVSRRHDQNYQI